MQISLEKVETKDFLNDVFYIPIAVNVVKNYAFSGETNKIIAFVGDVELEPLSFSCCSNLTFRCFRGSSAHEYALENGIDFEFWE